MKKWLPRIAIGGAAAVFVAICIWMLAVQVTELKLRNRNTFKLRVKARGNGLVRIEPKKKRYEDGEIVVLSAQGDPGWAFDHWTGDVMGMRTYDASAQVWMIENRSITAVFIERPGLTEVDFIGDLEYFLQDIGAEEDISTFDGNEIRYNAKVERVYVGNGIPDVAELCLVEAILNRRSLDHSFRSGVYHDFIWDIWNVNLAQAAVDLPDEDPRIHRVVAGYMTLGDYKSEGFIDKLVTIHYNSEGLNTAAYETNGQRYLYYKADADNDGVSNYQEWEYASPDNSIANIPEFVDAALDGVKPQGSQQSALADRPVDLFAPEMDQRFAAVDHSTGPHFDAQDAGTITPPKSRISGISAPFIPVNSELSAYHFMGLFHFGEHRVSY